MKSPIVIVLAALVITSVILATVSAYAFSYSATTSNQSNVYSSGAYGNYPNGMMGGYMGSGMMGSWMDGNSGTYANPQTPATTQNTILPILGFGALIGAVFAGTGGIAFFLLGSKTKKPAAAAESKLDNTQSADTAYLSVSKTLTGEERRVLGVLVSHDGKHLQKYIRAETGLSRLQTHRIVARLAERGIVTLEKSGNTNEVRLSSWLTSKPDAKKENEMQEIKVET